MKNFTKTVSAIAFSLLSLGSLDAVADCNYIGTNGKSAVISITPIAIVPQGGNSCSGGYLYDVKINYSIVKSAGTTINDIAGTFTCAGNNNFTFNNYVSGSGTFTTGNAQYRNINDCASATPAAASLNCGSLSMTVQFQGGGNVTANCSFSAISTPLPVKLLSFDAAVNNNRVNLVWTTALETSNAYFILERSNNAQDWTAITKMDGTGASRINNSYNYTDEMPVSGMNYYRLKQVDAGGVASYSRILAVEATSKTKEISLYPNPNNGENIKFNGLQMPADWSVKILNTTSAVVYQSAAIAEGISLPALPTGLYYVQLHNSKTGQSEVIKMMRK